MPGYEVAAKLEKLGWHSSDTGELSFTDVEVPARTSSARRTRASADHVQLRLGAAADGDRRRRRDAAADRDHVGYAQDRQAFGRPIGNFQVIRHKVAEMATQAEAARAITYDALRLFHAGRTASRR